MRCLAPRARAISAHNTRLPLARLFQHHHSQTRHFGAPQSPNNRRLQQLPLLDSWDADLFHEKAYLAAFPTRLPRTTTSLSPACWKWFIHDGDVDFSLTKKLQDDSDGSTTGDRLITELQIPRSSELRASFWREHAMTIVPLELTFNGPTDKPVDRTGDENDDNNLHHISLHNLHGQSDNIHDGYSAHETFYRVEAPLNLLLTYLSSPSQSDSHSIYLAQCELSSLPASLQHDIPTPDLLLHPRGAIKGDIYSSSLWLGRPPTYTPLHRDPNPNLFLQLAGRKNMRLLPPDIGDAVFADIQRQLPSSSSSSAAIRGEDMMAGPEKALLHDAVWADTNDNNNKDSSNSNSNRYASVIQTYAFEVELGLGEGLFIPKGWWHSVKGVGEGVTSSVNWWFR